MYQDAVRMIEAAAAMYGVQVSMKLMGGCAAGTNDPERHFYDELLVYLNFFYKKHEFLD